MLIKVCIRARKAISRKKNGEMSFYIYKGAAT